MELRLDNELGGCEIEASGQVVKLSHDEMLSLYLALAPIFWPPVELAHETPKESWRGRQGHVHIDEGLLLKLRLPLDLSRLRQDVKSFLETYDSPVPKS